MDERDFFLIVEMAEPDGGRVDLCVECRLQSEALAWCRDTGGTAWIMMGLIGAVTEVLTLTSELAASLRSRPNRARKYEKSCSSRSGLSTAISFNLNANARALQQASNIIKTPGLAIIDEGQRGLVFAIIAAGSYF